MVLFAWPAAKLVAKTNSSTKTTVVTKTTGHPEKATTAVAVHQTAKPKPAAKAEKVPKAPHANTRRVSGDYYWTATTGNGMTDIGLIRSVQCPPLEQPEYVFLPRICDALFLASIGKASNRTTGAAMDFLQKCDARNRLSADRSTSQNSFRPAAQADRTNSSGIETDGTRAKRLTFAEDFMLEHSHPGLHITRPGFQPVLKPRPGNRNSRPNVLGFLLEAS